MAYTLEKLKDVLKKRLQDEEFNDDLLTQFINDSMNEILGEDKYPFMQRIDRYIADADGAISIPIGYAGTFHIFANEEHQPRQELRYISPDEFFSNTRRHTFVWTHYANEIFYRIHKDENDDGFMITHLYLTNPIPVKNDDDITPIPDQYIEALILGALARAEETRDNFDYAQLYRNQQDQILTNMKLRFGPGNLTAQNTAKIPYGDRHYDSI